MLLFTNDIKHAMKKILCSLKLNYSYLITQYSKNLAQKVKNSRDLINNTFKHINLHPYAH